MHTRTSLHTREPLIQYLTNTQYYTHVSSSLLPKHVQCTCNTHFITSYYSKSIFQNNYVDYVFILPRNVYSGSSDIMLRLSLRFPLNSKPNHVVLYSSSLPSFCFSSIQRDEVPAMNASMLRTAVFELVQQFYHATEIGNVAQRSPNCGLRAKCGPRSHFLNDEKIIC